MDDLAKQLEINAGHVGRYLGKAHLADMTSRYFNGAMIGVSSCFFVSPDNQRGECIVFLLAMMGYATCIWLSSRWQRQINALADGEDGGSHEGENGGEQCRIELESAEKLLA